ncbi:hypothetical protein [Paracoccus benzoatiresistens]|uniref:Uncharacterized protein n=1 Tax=Paracoccus benzoatiresistens TaxID=2997341 RepID=A0ABT4IZQ6_9RHOB|nr:hypothetical protein [Paracoccus sp. EF6]MCZ0960349.1 hypothetical protein [Paracoccus sp. EF6]
MARVAEILYLGSAVIFVASGAVLATLGHPAAQIAAPILPMSYPYSSLELTPALPVATLPQLYVQPQNPLMWALLIALWLLLLGDAIGQYLDPSDGGDDPAWLPLSLALLWGALWPWLAGVNKPLATLGALLMLTAALSGAIRARGQLRPAPGFLAGWSLALGTATLASLIGAPLDLTTPQTAILAILPGAVIGMIAQGRLAGKVGFSLAMIWAFCAVAVTTMASSPGVALAAIIGISAMGVALVRAAT